MGFLVRMTLDFKLIRNRAALPKILSLSGRHLLLTLGHEYEQGRVAAILSKRTVYI